MDDAVKRLDETADHIQKEVTDRWDINVVINIVSTSRATGPECHSESAELSCPGAR